MNRYRWAVAAMGIGLAACDSGTGPGAGAQLDRSSVVANPHNVLSAVVWAVGLGDSARVIFRVAGAAGDSSTPAVQLTADSTRLPVLGLLPQSSYVMRVVLYGGSGSVLGDSLFLATGALPADLPSYTASGANPLPGYVVFSAAPFAIVLDNTGRVVWYRRFSAGGPGLNVQAQPAGVYIGRMIPGDGSGEYFLVLNALGDSVRSVRCGNGRKLRFHDALLEPDGTAWLMCDDTRTMDLTAHGGVAAAQVTATTVQHVSATGAVLFEWNAFDHFAITDLDPLDRTGPAVNFTHGNSLDRDEAGHILVSFRSLSEVTRIDHQTGAVLWRMGGPRSQFTFTGAGEPGYTRQHNIRSVAPGTFIILDNIGGPESRYERYTWSTATMTATLVQSYAAGVQTQIGGSVQRAGPGRWLASFGTEGRVREFDDAGNTQWQIDGDPGYVFRAQRITSLYSPGVGSAR